MLRLLLTIEAIADLVFGAALVTAPAALLAIYGVELGPTGEFTAQFGGGALVGWGVAVWLARELDDSLGRRAIIRGLFAASTLGAIVLIRHQLLGTMNVLGWSTVGLTLFFAIVWGYYSFRHRGPMATLTGSSPIPT